MIFRQLNVLSEDREELRNHLETKQHGSTSSGVSTQHRDLYRTDAASYTYLAARTVHIAEDNAQAEIVEVITKSFYLDDMLFGADTIKKEHKRKKQVNC